MDPEIIDLGSLDIGSGNGGKRSANFGGGLELLMNDRFKSGNNDKSGSTNINLEDITSLEDDLREMDSSSSRNIKELRSDLFNSSSSLSSSAFSNIKLSDRHDPFSNSIGGDGGGGNGDAAGVGASTAMFEDEKPTWDGFGKFNNVPMNPDVPMDTQPQLTKEELLRKFKYVKNWKI